MNNELDFTTSMDCIKTAIKLSFCSFLFILFINDVKERLKEAEILILADIKLFDQVNNSADQVSLQGEFRFNFWKVVL